MPGNTGQAFSYLEILPSFGGLGARDLLLAAVHSLLPSKLTQDANQVLCDASAPVATLLTLLKRGAGLPCLGRNSEVPGFGELLRGSIRDWIGMGYEDSLEW